jgi:hypothetical protein
MIEAWVYFLRARDAQILSLDHSEKAAKLDLCHSAVYLWTYLLVRAKRIVRTNFFSKRLPQKNVFPNSKKHALG